MQKRLNIKQAAPDALKAMIGLESYLSKISISKTAKELIKIRASQINGCAYCIHMHATYLRKHGESEMRLYMLDAWRESSLYSERERAALGWTEALTRLAETRAPDEDYERLKAQFTESEQVNLTLAIGAINVWNRLQVGFRAAHPIDEARDAA